MSRNDEINNDNAAWNREISKALKVPVADPGPRFTRAVVEHTEEAPRSWWLSHRALIGAAAVTAMLIAAALTLRPVADPHTSAADQIRSLAREQRLLRNELEDLQRLRQSAAPVVYLAGDENLEFVYALNDPRLMGGSQPAGDDYRTADR